ncbi:MAG: hypothetical protein ABIE94_04365 [archaeon]
MIAELIVIWAASIYFSMFFAGQKDLNITKAFWYSIIFGPFALIFYLLWVPKDRYDKYKWAWGGLGFLMLWIVGTIFVIYLAKYVFTNLDKF